MRVFHPQLALLSTVVYGKKEVLNPARSLVPVRSDVSPRLRDGGGRATGMSKWQGGARRDTWHGRRNAAREACSFAVLESRVRPNETRQSAGTERGDRTREQNAGTERGGRAKRQNEAPERGGSTS